MTSERCRGCAYVASIDHASPEKKTLYCNYIGCTGHARMFICESGDECLVFTKRSSRAKGRPKRGVIQYDMDGNEIKRFDGLYMAGRSAKIDPSAIRGCAIGKSKHAGGFKWKYTDDIEAKQEA